MALIDSKSEGLIYKYPAIFRISSTSISATDHLPLQFQIKNEAIVTEKHVAYVV